VVEAWGVGSYIVFRKVSDNKNKLFVYSLESECIV
jgi:hypothetical protein